nr:hypothetical protein Iba_chr06dCG10540 [Ipomoea batatas]
MASIRTYGQGSSPRRRTSFSRSTNTSCQPDLKGSSNEGRTGSTAILFAGQPVGDIKLLDLDAFRICDVSYWGTEPSRHCSGLTTGLTVESEKILRSKPADQYIVLAVAKKLAGVVVAAAECY